MKKIILTLSIILLSTTVYAADLFYNKNINGWFIGGNNKNKELNASCFMEKRWNDGSSFMFIKDLEDGEVYVMMNNNQWIISDNPGNYNMRVNFHYSNGRINGGNAVYELLNKNTIRIRGIKSESFMNDFVSASKMIFIMPGTINNVIISLENSSLGVDNLIDCVKVYKSKGNSKGTRLDL